MRVTGAEGLPPFTGEMSEGQRGQVQNTPAISYESGQPHTMIPLITQHSDELAEICRRHDVKHLEIFGWRSTIRLIQFCQPVHNDRKLE